MNKNFYEYLDEYQDDIYPIAYDNKYRQNIVPNDFNDMMDFKQFGQQENNCGLFNTYEGFIKGNIFKKLYKPYKNYTPRRLNPKNKKEEMLYKIYELCFNLIDMNLYLDLNPKDSCVLNKYNKILLEKNNLTKEYEKQYGPLTINSYNVATDIWNWDNVKSPWKGDF